MRCRRYDGKLTQMGKVVVFLRMIINNFVIVTGREVRTIHKSTQKLHRPQVVVGRRTLQSNVRNDLFSQACHDVRILA